MKRLRPAFQKQAICAYRMCAIILLFELPNIKAYHTANWNILKNSTTKSNPTNLVVKLAIICDQEFSSLFQHDEHKMKNYWKAVVYNVHLRYQTLPSFNFSFQITSFHVLKKPVPAVEEFRNELGELAVREVLFNIENWMGTKVKKLPAFDIAVIATGSSPWGEMQGVASKDSICLGNSIPGQWISNVVVSVRKPDIARLLSHVIGHVLGATFDNEETYLQNNCGVYPESRHTFIMNNDGGSKRHFFSRCTDKMLQNAFNEFPPTCLLPSNAKNNVLYDSSRDLPSPLTLLEQCQIRTGNLDVYTQIHKKTEPCKLIECHPIRSSNEKLQYVVPLDGSACLNTNEGQCFRELCLQPGVQLVNLENEMCIGGQTDNLSLLRIPKPTTCQFGEQFPWNKISLFYDDLYGTLVAYMSDVMDKDGEWLKCLAFGPYGIPKFERCFSSYEFGWEMWTLQTPTNTEFQLRHISTDFCLKAVHNTIQLISPSECYKSDTATLWKVVMGNGTVTRHSQISGYVQKPVVINYENIFWTWWDIVTLACFLAFVDQFIKLCHEVLCSSLFQLACYLLISQYKVELFTILFAVSMYNYNFRQD